MPSRRFDRARVPAVSRRICAKLRRTPVIRCSPDDRYEKAVELMEEHRIRRVLVTDNFERVVGVIAESDIALRLRRFSGAGRDRIWFSKEAKEMAEQQKCAHPACNCPAPEHSKYCSTYCHDASHTTELSCNCGHPGCAEELTHRG